MTNKLLVGVVVVVVVIAAVAAAIVMMDGDEQGGGSQYDIDDLQLMVHGNANKDFTIDENDRDTVQSVIDGDAKLADYPFADVNDDGRVDQADLDLLDKIIDREPCTVYVSCVDRNGDDVVKSVEYPLTNIASVGVGAITATLYTNAGDKVVTYASFPTSYSNTYAALGGKSFTTAEQGTAYDWQIFTQIDQETPVSAMFIDYQYAGFLSDNEYDSLDLGGIPYLIYKVSSPNAHTSAAVTIGFLCGEETEKVGYRLAQSTYDVLTHIKSIVEDIPEEERSTFITLARSTSISQNSHANNDVGIIGGGIPYYEVNPDFASKYEGTGTENSAEDALAPYRDADAYISITSKDFGSDPDQVVLDLMKASASIDPLKFFHGVLDNWYYINNLLPGAIKAAYAAEALYPELFEGYGDEVAQRFIDEGYSPLVGQTPESLCGFLTYQDYLDAGGEPA